MAQEYHKRTKKMEQLQKKLQTGRGRVSRATEELEGAQGAVAAMEEEERLLEGEVEDLRGRIAEEREGRIEEREGRVSEVMEVTETAVEGGVANKKKVKRVGRGRLWEAGSQVRPFCGRWPRLCRGVIWKGFKELGGSFWTKSWTEQSMRKEKEKTLNWMLKNLPTPRLILLLIRVGDFCSLGVGSF